MAEISIEAPQKPSRIRFDWVPSILFQPKRTFELIGSVSGAVWLTPLLIFSLAVLSSSLTTGWLRQIAAQTGEVSLPPDFQYYTPEQQAQILQAMQTTSGPVFMYVIPSIIGLGGVWIGWLVVSGLLHFILTLLGGRGDTGVSLNLVAWSGIPLVVREIVRTIAMLISRQTTQSPGLSGFTPGGDSEWLTYVNELLKLIDIYMVWNIILLVIGVISAAKLAKSKAWTGVILTILIVLGLQALLGFFGVQLSGLTITRPFFF